MDFKISLLLTTYTRSENGYGFKRPGLKKAMKNDIF